MDKVNRKYAFILNQEQDDRLTESMQSLGFTKKSDYIRFTIFMNSSFIEKINEMHKKICGGENAGKN